MRNNISQLGNYLSAKNSLFAGKVSTVGLHPACTEGYILCAANLKHQGGIMAGTRRTKVLIIGSGPAGYTAGVYASRAMLEPILVQGIEPGGHIRHAGVEYR